MTRREFFIGGTAALMIRSSLAASSPLEAIVMRTNHGGEFGCCRCVTEGGSISQPQSVNGDKSWEMEGDSDGTTIRIRRRGNVITSYFKVDGATSWTKMTTPARCSFHSHS